jgi:hypothetical protein
MHSRETVDRIETLTYEATNLTHSFRAINLNGDVVKLFALGAWPQAVCDAGGGPGMVGVDDGDISFGQSVEDECSLLLRLVALDIETEREEKKLSARFIRAYDGEAMPLPTGYWHPFAGVNDGCCDD